MPKRKSPNMIGDEDDESSDGAVSETEMYTVEAIRKWRYNLEKEQKEFFVKWENYGEDENTWEPEEHLTQSSELMKEFIDILPEEELQYFNNELPEKLTGFQRNASFVEICGCDGPHESDGENSSKKNKQKFYILVKFEDCPRAEEVTLDELMKYRIDDALKFCEERLIYKGCSE